MTNDAHDQEDPAALLSDAAILAEVPEKKKRGRKPGGGRKIGFQEKSTRVRMNLAKRETMIQDLMNLHSSVMHTVQILIDRVAGLELRFAMLAENFETTRDKISAAQEQATTEQAALVAKIDESTRAVLDEIKKRPVAEAVQEPRAGAGSIQASVPRVVPAATAGDMTFSEVCVNLYKEQGLVADSSDGVALVKLFDIVLMSLPGDASPPERVAAFIQKAAATERDQQARPRDWDFDFIS